MSLALGLLTLVLLGADDAPAPPMKVQIGGGRVVQNIMYRDVEVEGPNGRRVVQNVLYRNVGVGRSMETGDGPAPRTEAVAPITFQFRTLEMTGLEWRGTFHPRLQPVARQGTATIWTAGPDVLPGLVARASRELSAPKVNSTSRVLVALHSNRPFVAELKRIGDGPFGHAKGVAYVPEMGNVAEGTQIEATGRPLDQGVLARVAIEDTQSLAFHPVSLTEPNVNGVTLTTHVQVPEVASCTVAGEWLIPKDGLLVVSLGAHTVAEKGKAVVKERVVVLQANPASDASVSRAAARAAAVVPSPTEPRPLAGMPELPSRSLPGVVGASVKPGEPVELPPLPDDQARPASAESASSEPRPSPQSCKEVLAAVGQVKCTGAGRVPFPPVPSASSDAPNPVPHSLVPASPSVPFPPLISASAEMPDSVPQCSTRPRPTAHSEPRRIGAVSPHPGEPPTVQYPEASETWEMTLRDAVRIALENSEVVRVVPSKAHEAVAGACCASSSSLCSKAGASCPTAKSETSAGRRGAEWTRIAIAPAKDDVSLWRFRSEVTALVRSVEQQYWALAQQRVQLWVRETAVNLGEEIAKRVQAELKAGRATAADLAEAQQQLERFRLDLVTATSDVITTERQLRNLLGLPPADNRRIVPVTAPTVARVKPSWDANLATMMSHQPDIRQQQAVVRVAMMQLIAARNQLLPTLSLDDLAQLKALGGANNLDTAEMSSVRRMLQALQPMISASDFQVWEGGWTLKWSQPRPQGFQTWQSGGTFQMPIGMRAPLANTRNAQYTLLRQKAFLQQVVHQTTHSLARFFLEVDANYKQFKAASRYCAEAAQRLNEQKKEYEAGKLTLDRYLDAVTQWADAVAQEAQFKSSYNTSLVAIEEAKGTLLDFDQIEVVADPRNGSCPALHGTEPPAIDPAYLALVWEQACEAIQKAVGAARAATPDRPDDPKRDPAASRTSHDDKASSKTCDEGAPDACCGSDCGHCPTANPPASTRSTFDEWEEFWSSDRSDSVTPFRTHGGVGTESCSAKATTCDGGPAGSNCRMASVILGLAKSPAPISVSPAGALRIRFGAVEVEVRATADQGQTDCLP